MVGNDYVFPAIFSPEGDGYNVIFPDLKSCYTQGDDLVDAFTMAGDVLGMTLYRMEKNGEVIPQPSDLLQIKKGAEDVVMLVGCDTRAFFKLYDFRAVKKNCTLPAWLNTKAEEAGINFSAVLQEGIKKALHLEE